MEAKSQGVIYILTNPSFPDYVKIGYADDVNKRLKEKDLKNLIEVSAFLSLLDFMHITKFPNV